jgi:hypothetical protein
LLLRRGRQNGLISLPGFIKIRVVHHQFGRTAKVGQPSRLASSKAGKTD